MLVLGLQLVPIRMLRAAAYILAGQGGTGLGEKPGCPVPTPVLGQADTLLHSVFLPKSGSVSGNAL